MYLLEIRSSEVDSVKKELPAPNLHLDPRPIECDATASTSRDYGIGMTFEITYEYFEKNTKVTITRTGQEGKHRYNLFGHLIDEEGWHCSLKFRVYDPAKESIPRFDLTTYRYLGIEGEEAPKDSVKVIIDEAVKIIRTRTFYKCKEMKVCEMHDDIEEIEDNAFRCCKALKTIKLPKSLKLIGQRAFLQCAALRFIFIPSSIEKIEWNAFLYCTDLRIFYLPSNITTDQLDIYPLQECDDFFRITGIQYYDGRVRGPEFCTENCDEVHENIIDFYRNLPPLYRICHDTNISADKIRECLLTYRSGTAATIDHDGMTPLHVLAINPHVDMECILVYLNSSMNMNAAFVRDHSNMTPIDYLWEYDKRDSIVAVVQALCMHREANKNMVKE